MTARHTAGVALILAGLLPATAAAQLTTTVVATGLARPVAFVVDPLDPSTFYVVEQGGTIRTLHNGTLSPTLFLDLQGQLDSSGERGLLGMAFSPDTGSTGRFFVNFTNLAGHTVVARFRRDALGIVDPASRFDLMWPDGRRFIEQPFANHNGGNLAFGPDGYLYIGMGDGGSGGDPLNNAQNPNSLLGKMLRINVMVPDSNTRGYVVPDNNPFVGGQPIAALTEIWAFGLRNPWRYSFDDPTRGGSGALVIADVGQSAREEVNWEPPGAGGRNYGWPQREGKIAYDPSRQVAYQPLTPPVHDYPRSDGMSVTGGYVYRGTHLPAVFKGKYFFADFILGRIYTMGVSLDLLTAVDVQELTGMLGGSTELGQISAFGVDSEGEMYLVSYSRSRVVKIVPAP